MRPTLARNLATTDEKRRSRDERRRKRLLELLDTGEPDCRQFHHRMDIEVCGGGAQHGFHEYGDPRDFTDEPPEDVTLD